MKKGKRDVHSSFVALDRSLLFKCDSWKGLTPGEKLFYVYLRAKFNGGNNGQIKLHYSELKGIWGFSSNETISWSIRELEAARWIELRMTIEGVAAAAGISPAMVRGVEVRALVGSLFTRAKIADALKIRRTWLISKAEASELQDLVQDKGRAK